MNTTQQEYDKIMAILDRIEEKIDIMEKRLDKAIEKIDNKSRNTANTAMKEE